MRITGGEWGGRTLRAPSGQNTRPTSDANREALFNIIAHSFGHKMNCVADLYAGSGALGFEALSHGAQKLLMFEKDPQALKCIKQNCELLRIDSSVYKIQTSPRPEDWFRYLEDQAKEWGPFDTLFCDPPYGKGLVERALKRVLVSNSLTPEALICVELAKEEESPIFEGWNCEQRRERGASAQCFYRRVKIVT